jgi:hypothetical protein
MVLEYHGSTRVASNLGIHSRPSASYSYMCTYTCTEYVLDTNACLYSESGYETPRHQGWRRCGSAWNHVGCEVGQRGIQKMEPARY